MRSGAMRRLIAILAAAAPLAAASAEERRVMVTSFDRVRVEGPFAVEIRTGASPAATAKGSRRALDSVDIRLEDRALVVRTSPDGWGGWPDDRTEAPTVLITTPRLTALSVSGSGSASVDAMRGADVSVGLTGSGRVDVKRIEADRLEAVLAGSGALMLGGSARTARMTNTGVGTIDAQALSVRDLTLQSESAGDSSARATQTANVTAIGTGGVTVAGPAACARSGPGPINCGR